MSNNLKEAQQIMLNILVEFERVCTKYNLVYWLDYGTLLGAVRHQGFIPWDDDLDVSMPREDYENFLSVAPKELDSKYFLQNKTTDKHIYIHYTKIRYCDSSFIEKYEIGKNVQYNQGIYIDIFPVNYIKKDIFTKSSYTFLKGNAKVFSNRFINLNFIAKKYINILNSYHHASATLCVRGGEKMSNELFIFKSNIFPLNEENFEGLNFKVPHNCDNYLIALYGRTYMTLPPKNERVSHSHSINITKTHP